MIEVDAVLFEQVLFNLLDNAAKYADAGTTVRVQSWRDSDPVYLQILDEGRVLLLPILSRYSTSSGNT